MDAESRFRIHPSSFIIHHSSLTPPPVTTSQRAFAMAVGGVGFQVHLPDGAWLDALAPLYARFPLDCEPHWQVTIRHEPGLDPVPRRWIEHIGPVTRFHADGFAGWIDLEQRRAEVAAPGLAHGASAVERAAGYACMHALLRERNSLMLHAAGILWREQGLIASGHSGAGKTTMARLALACGEPINDEIVIVDLAGPQPLLLSTPFLGQGTPPELARRVKRAAPATALLLLAHGSTFHLAPLAPAEAVMELLRTNIAAVERFDSARLWMERVDQLVQAVPVYRLHFRPTVELWDFLAAALPAAPAAAPCAS